MTITTGTTTLERLEARFDRHYTLDGAPFLKAAQVVHRLNEVLGLGGWQHIVLRDGYDEATDTWWCYGRLVGQVDGEPFVRESYGGQRIKRSRTTNVALSYGDDMKAAQTDSLKKCGKALGIGLYLDDPDEVKAAAAEQAAAARQLQAQARTTNGRGPDSTNREGTPVNTSSGEVFECVDCGAPLEVVRFQDNRTWSVAQLVEACERLPDKRHRCKKHYFEAKNRTAGDVAARTGVQRGSAPVEAGA